MRWGSRQFTFDAVAAETRGKWGDDWNRKKWSTAQNLPATRTLDEVPYVPMQIYIEWLILKLCCQRDPSHFPHVLKSPPWKNIEQKGPLTGWYLHWSRWAIGTSNGKCSLLGLVSLQGRKFQLRRDLCLCTQGSHSSHILIGKWSALQTSWALSPSPKYSFKALPRCFVGSVFLSTSPNA